MRLNSLELSQVCQHEHLLWEFRPGLVGVYGPNGSGKSNALNVAAYGGLTNDYSRHTNGKFGMIRQQAEPYDKSEIKLVFTHDEHQYTIIRGLQNPVKHLMVRSGKKDLKKANDIQEELESVLGISRRLVDNYLFVGQDQLFAFLSAVASERAKSFAHLCNTTHAELCWELLGEQITADQPFAQGVDDNRDAIREQVGEYKVNLRMAAQDLAQARLNLLSKQDKAQHEKTVRDWQEKQLLLEEIPVLETQEASLLKVAKLKRKAYLMSESELHGLEQDDAEKMTRRDEIIAELATLDEQIANMQQKNDLTEELGRLESAVVDLGDSPEEPDDVDQEEAADRLLFTEQEIVDLTRLTSVEGKPVCPTCGTSAESLRPRVEQAKIDLAGALKEKGQIDTYLRKVKDQYTALRCHTAVSIQLFDKIAAVNKSLSVARVANAKPVLSGAEAKLKAEKKQIDKDLEQVENSRARHAIADKAFVAAKAEHQAMARNLQGKQEKRNAYSVSEDDHDVAYSDLAKHQIANTAVSVAKASIDQLEGFIKGRTEEIERVTRLVDRCAGAAKWVAALQDVRDAVMHRDKLPKVVHRDNLLDMEEDINATLAMFNTPFSVEATQDVDFVAHFQNGTSMPADGLSGGQKVMLAVPYRLTVNSLFAAQVGMMVLDEPTDGLDADNRVLAAEVFRQLGEVARSRGHQVIVITHDDALETVFDQKFTLQRPI